MNWQCCHCHCRESCCRVSRYSLRHAFTEMNDYFEEVSNELVCCSMLCLYDRYFRNSADEARINHSSLNKIVELVDVIPFVIMVLLNEVDPVSHARNPSKFVPITTKSCRTDGLEGISLTNIDPWVFVITGKIVVHDPQDTDAASFTRTVQCGYRAFHSKILLFK